MKVFAGYVITDHPVQYSWIDQSTRQTRKGQKMHCLSEGKGSKLHVLRTDVLTATARVLEVRLSVL